MGWLGRIVLRIIISILIVLLVLSGNYDIFQCFLIVFALIGIDTMIEGFGRKQKGVNE